jgi:hypothetical protein
MVENRPSYFLAFALSVLGMLAGHLVARQWEATTEASTTATTLSASRFELVDARGRRQILMDTSSEGSPAVWFFDKNGKARLNVGLYGDDNAFLVLNDDHENAVGIFRTLGAASDPFLVMKAEGRDRIVMGLGGVGHDPFLVYYDDNGAQHSVFGSWSR